MSAIQQITVRSILSKSKLPGIDFVINPYCGCQPACVYCYACFMQKFDGLETYIFVGPILPYLTGWKQIVRQTKKFVDYYLFDHTNSTGRIWNHLHEWLLANHPDLLHRYQQICRGQSDYWQQVSRAIHTFSKSENINYQVIF